MQPKDFIGFLEILMGLSGDNFSSEYTFLVK